jgi:hypothetical protein
MITNIKAGGLRAVCCDTLEPLPDLCHHAEYRIYVNGQYVESVGNLGPECSIRFAVLAGGQTASTGRIEDNPVHR